MLRGVEVVLEACQRHAVNVPHASWMIGGDNDFSLENATSIQYRAALDARSYGDLRERRLYERRLYEWR
ncbi:MAG: hypothetical protein ABJC66_10535, partial [Gammaproteobacteria bacterium]